MSTGPSWAWDDGKAKGNSFGQAGDGNPQYALKANSGEPHDLEPLDHTEKAGVEFIPGDGGQA